MNIKEIISAALDFSEELREYVTGTVINTAYIITTQIDISLLCLILALCIILPVAGQKLCTLCKQNEGIRAKLIRFFFIIWIGPIIVGAVLTVISYGYTMISLKSRYQDFYTTLIVVLKNNQLVLGTTVILSCLLAIALRYLVARKIEPAINRWLITGTKRGSRDYSVTDVTRIDDYLPHVQPFNPELYFNKAKKGNSFFIGKNENNKPIYLDREVLKKNNIDIVGPPGSGKGIQASVLLAQCIRSGYATVISAPKPDEWAQSTYSSICSKANMPFTYVDISDGSPHQLSPFQGAKSNELNELLSSALSLGRKGEAADFYRNSDRKALKILTNENPKSFYELIHSAPTLLGAELLKQSQGLLDQLEELSSISSIRTEDNDDIFQKVIDNGGCLYIEGSTRSEATLMLQKMFVIRVTQLVEKRERGGRHVVLFADELKYQLSSSFINATGTVRDKGMTIITAHQSLGDLETTSTDLSPKAIRQTILDNTPIKWIYRAKDIEVATWASQLTGTTIIDKEVRNININEADSELLSNERRVSQSERNLYDTNIIQHLPDRCGLCIGVGKATLAFSYPLKIEKKTCQLLDASPLMISCPSSELLPENETELL
jgi:hypothetical protein